MSNFAAVHNIGEQNTMLQKKILYYRRKYYATEENTMLQKKIPFDEMIISTLN